jgi:septal ring factor EnvC (AmiA/AmiB activator)
MSTWWISLLLVVVLVPGSRVCSSTRDEIRKRQAELETLRDQIRAYEQTIKQQQQNERATLELLDTYDRKATAVRRLIARLHAEEREIENAIEATRKDLSRLEEQLAFLKTHYANYVTSIYRTGRIYDLELLLSSRSVNQLYIRTEYLKRFSAQRKNDARKIEEKKGEIEESQARLEQQLGEGRRLIAEKGAEEDRLEALASERKDVLQGIRKDKKNVQREIERKLKSAIELENLIADLIEADRVKREREAEQIRAGKLPQPPPVIGAFEAKKGKLRWPVAEGSVVARFGNQIHPTLRTVTQNTGIDIAVSAGSPVNAVADGEIGKIWWLPSYGNLIIINHINGFHTVYAHLSEIRVNEGQKVKEGEVIGSSGEALEGPRLHFELWKEREKQNPEPWLSVQ